MIMVESEGNDSVLKERRSGRMFTNQTYYG